MPVGSTTIEVARAVLPSMETRSAPPLSSAFTVPNSATASLPPGLVVKALARPSPISTLAPAPASMIAEPPGVLLTKLVLLPSAEAAKVESDAPVK